MKAMLGKQYGITVEAAPNSRSYTSAIAAQSAMSPVAARSAIRAENLKYERAAWPHLPRNHSWPSVFSKTG